MTGLDASALQSLAQQLSPLGLPTAQPLARDPHITLSNWHQRVHAAGQNPPARMWELLASELFLANMAQTQWSWADPLALPLLDYWAAFDPAIRFILVAENPLQTALRHQSIETADTAKTDEASASRADNPQTSALHHWQQTHHAILRFALRHPHRCLLLWQHQTHDPVALAQTLQTRWGLNLTAPSSPGPSTSINHSTPIVCALAHHLGQVLTQNHPNAQQLLTDLQANVQPLLHSPVNITTSAPEPHELLARYQELSELSQQAAQLTALQHKLKTQTQKTADTEKSRADLQIQHANQLSQAQAELKQAQEQAKAAKAASDQQQSALQKLQAELQQTQTQAQDQEQAKAAQAQKEQLQQKHKESQEEAELLLNQLHVVQEELENYYYRNKELQAQASELTQLQQRWQQLFAQNRDLYAVENLSIQARQGGQFVCQLQQLDMAGRHFDQLELSLQLQPDGSTAMLIQRPTEGQGPLLRWPTDVAPGTALMLQPQLHPDTPPQRVAAFIQLCSSDWQLVQNLHRLLLAALAQGLPTLPAPEQQSLHTALQQSQQHLQGLRHMLRFDAAQCPQAPTPEQLHLQLQGVSLQGQHTPQLTLQLQQHSPQYTSLLIDASPLTANGQSPAAAIQIHLTPQGWYSNAPTPAQLPHLLGQLMGVLPLALVDAVHHGTEKASLKPWADTCRTLRQWPQTPCEPPQAATAAEPKTTAKPKAKTTAKPAAKANPKPKPIAKQKTTALATEKAKPKPKASVEPAHAVPVTAPSRAKSPRRKATA